MGKTSRFLFNRFLEKFLCSIFACFLFTCAGVFSANALTVTYSCGTSTGTAPTDSTNYSSNDTVTVESNTCIVPSGEYFVGYVCGSKSVVPNDTFAITANTTCTAQYSGYKFNLTTTSVASFSFKISATGNFLVDCGDGGTLSGTGVSGNIITRSDTTIATYTCTWASAGAHTINFGGLATGYSNFTGDNKANANNSAAITFNTQASDGAIYTNAVASISGSLGAIFPTLGSADTKQPAFVGTFKQCRSLTSVPATLFSGVSGTRANMFRETFDRCSNLTTVPSNLFANIAGAGKPSLFRSTFNQTKLPSIPAGIFSGVTSAASNLFRYTFGDVTTLTGYIPPSTFAGLIANGSPTATDMWSSTFINCSGLATSCDDFPGTEQVSTTYTGTVNDGLATTWNGRVSCQVLATYNVTYDCGSGATGTAPTDSNDYLHGDYVTIANNTCTKSGSTFTGWSCGGYDVVPGETFLIEDDTTCTAQWSACTACAAINASCSLSVVNNVCTYTTECEEGFSDIQNNGAYNAYCSANKVIYDCGKGSGTAPIDSTDYVEGGTVTALENTCDAPSYEIFDYWDCNGNSVAAGDEFMISEDVTCEAQYTNGLVVSYDCGAGSGTVPTDDKGYVPGTSVTTANNTCTKSGNIFTGWSCDGNIVNAVSTFTISDNTTCTAQWSACTACATTNASCSLSVVNNVCTYMTECDSGYGRIQNNGSYNASCSLLNAHFVTYSCGTGSGTAPVDDTEHLYGSSVITVSASNNTCVAPSNSEFVGWSCSGTPVSAGSSFTISDDTTCTAQWSACTPCAATNASCSVSVVNNVCTYATACNSGYGNIQNNGAYNASCTALSSCTDANYEYNGECVPCPYGYEYNIENGKSSINQCQAHCSGGTTMTNYTRVAYLENSGDTTDGQFFDTNEFIETSNVKIEIGIGTAVTRDDTKNDYGNLFGNQTDSDGVGASYKKGVLGLWHEANSNKLSVNFVPMSADVQYDLVYVVDEPYKSITVSSNGNQLYFNSDRGAQQTASNVSLKIFASSAELQNGNITFPVKGDGLFDRGRVYYFKLWDGGDLKLDLIPVRNSNGVLGLYNNIDGSFFPNAGTGTFNAGPDEYAFAVGTCQNVGDGYYIKAKTINYGSAAPSANRCPDDAPTNKQNASSILECEGFTCGSGRYYDETAEQCTDCTACSPTNATCSLGVVDNVCTYTTACESGYENIQHNGEYNPSCSLITYNVTYACGMGSGTAPTDSTVYASGTSVTTVSAANNTCTAPSNSIFTGWSCGGNTVNAGSTFNISANTTCTAQWSECTACEPTNATCELSVVNNTCTYTTTCNTHYGNIQNNGEYNASCSINSYTCSSGEYLPADGLACESCLRGHTCAGGTFNYDEDDDQGIVINSYTCSSGQYLPANAIACETCPTGHTCSGGTFNFNAKDFQGLVLDTDSPIPANTNVCAENFPPSLKATYDINTYTCSPGYYLPADATECIKCLENNYCVGGSYTFNPTDNQGITHCSGDLRAPQGMWESEQCGRRFNVGGKYVYSRSTRKTSPSINLDMDLNGTTEFYISLSKIPVPMNVDFANLSQHNKLVIDLPKAYVNSVGVNVPAGKYYAYDDTMTYDLKTLDATISGSDYGYINGAASPNHATRHEDMYGLTDSNTWGTLFSYGKVIGDSYCSSRVGANHVWTWGGNTSDWTATDSQVKAGVGQYCWCRVVGVVNGDTNEMSLTGIVLPPSHLTWVFRALDGASACEQNCAGLCSNDLQTTGPFRRALFGQSDN